MSNQEIPVMPETQAMRDIFAERHRQINEKGYTPHHDDDHVDGSLVPAAIAYITGDAVHWPWGDPTPSFNDMTPRERYVKAAALLQAEVERMDRQKVAEG